MKSLFVDILEITLPISAWIVLLLMCSPLLKRSYVAKWRYFMWLFVAARLVFPFKMRTKAPITMSIPQEIADVQKFDITSGHTFTVLGVLTAVWIAGIAIAVLYQVFSYFSFKNFVKRWSEKVTDERILKTFGEVKASSGVKCNAAITKCKAVSTPMIFGIVKPVLLLPYVEFSDDELPIILRHELVHLKRHDIWFKLLLIAARTIHWFNPLIYIMFRAANKDMELACDAEVVKYENAEFRRHYCEAIMRLVHNGRGKSAELSTCFFFSKKTVLERFRNILDDKIKRSGIIMFCVVAFSVAVSGGAITFATERVAEELEENLQIEEQISETPEPTAIPEEEPIQIENEPPYEKQEYIPQRSVRTPVQRTESKQDIVSENTDYGVNPVNTAEVTGKAESVEDIAIGDERSDIYEQLGEPDSVSNDRSKETYNLPDGSTAILQYDGDVLDSGYIVIE